MDDLEGALDAYRWYEEQFPDDSGEPGNHLCWTLALFRSGDVEAASAKLRQTMLLNLYLISDLLGEQPQEFEMWHGCNQAEIQYLEYIPPDFLNMWDRPAREWARQRYKSEGFRRIRDRFIEIHKELADLPPGPRRSELVREASALEDGDLWRRISWETRSFLLAIPTSFGLILGQLDRDPTGQMSVGA